MTLSASMLENIAGHCEEGEHKYGVPGRLADVMRMHGWRGPVPEKGADLSPTLALAWVDAVLPGWILEHLADNATGDIGALKWFGAACELSDGETTVQGMSHGNRHDYGPNFNRATAILVAGLKALAHVERRRSETA